ncbi:MAG: DUF2232 domain-containing protein [Thioalkalispiraceae bacterium]|jgi:hypothetical protein
MKALAAYMMRGRLQAMMAAAGLAVVSLLMMPLSWPVSLLSGAAVALAVLVQGPKEGALTALGASALLALITMLVLQLPMMAFVYAVMVWLPAWLLATALLLSQSLGLALKLGALLGITIILLVYSVIPDPAGLWYEHITQQVLPMLEKAGVVLNKPAGFDAQLREATRIMTGTTVAFTVMGMWLSLLIARSWQAKLYRPEGFGNEFRSLKLGQQSALLVALVAALAVFTSGLLNELSINALVVLLMLFMFQGLAVAHSLVYQLQQSKAWLIGIYVVLVFTLPHGLVIFAMIGWLDNGFDFRKRFARKQNDTGQSGD